MDVEDSKWKTLVVIHRITTYYGIEKHEHTHTDDGNNGCYMYYLKRRM